MGDGARADQIIATAREQRDDMLVFLEKMVVSESPSSVPESQGPVFDLIEAELDIAGYEVQRLPGESTLR